MIAHLPRLFPIAVAALFASAPLWAEATSPQVVETFENLRFSASPELQSGSAGLADLYVPVLPGDSIDKVEQAGTAAATAPSEPPVRVVGKLRPAIVVVHGGGWLAGSKWTISGYAQQLSQMGICVLNINYRLAPHAKFPAQVDDVREALVYLSDHAADLAIDPQRIGLFGYSAGGHLSALVGVLADESRQEQAEASRWSLMDPRWARLPKIAAVCAGGPPCDFQNLPLDNDSLSYFLRGSRRQFPELYAAASPIAHVSAADPPIQLIHGETDMIVPITNSRRFAEALAAAGVSVNLTEIAKQGHIVTLMHPQTQAQVSEFFREQLRLHP
ncbi:alpha/beta hydrolase [Allorhodopirellula solitaria]|uniref:Carboxylesterase NlhH n=1 Tax=Allorhodopirellula solitaria TaxID=2527987 RepID=A0A5C5Y1V2_9BACT|nr:alpha/beta hydrolase [Allorhodopirellula solitaria]TWT67522.1 Carboxylesterase NlhH [Allorhodopirellula solitaria]